MYNDFSKFYDRLQTDINYQRYADYIEKIIKRYKKDSKMVMDLGCGTGNLTVMLNEKGYDMTGLDISPDMLMHCYKKNKNILWIKQSMSEMDLFGTYDVFVSFLDSINHITDKRQLKKVFKLVHNYLNNDGLFIFDINTLYKFEHIFKDHVYTDTDEKLTYVWENSYNRKSKICDMYITFFEKSGKSYKRYEDYHRERAYSIDELKEMAIATNFKVLGVFKELTYMPVNGNDERAFIVLKKEQ